MSDVNERCRPSMPPWFDQAKSLRDKLCINAECTYDRGCACLDAIHAAFQCVADQESDLMSATMNQRSGAGNPAERPRVTDDDHGEITVSLDGKEVRGWSYDNEDERRQKMRQAREYIEGWCDGRDACATQ